MRVSDRGGFLTMFLSLYLIWTQLLITESSTGDHKLLRFPSHHPSHLSPPLHRQHDLNPKHHGDESHSRHHHHHHQQHEHFVRFAKVMPAALFRQELGGQQTLNLLARPHHEVQPEHAMVSARHLVTV